LTYNGKRRVFDNLCSVYPMNRTDRLLAIVLELQRRRRRYCRAEDLAAHFEVSKRTIYRDIQALCEAGVPIVAADRHGYALVDGYFLPPLHLSADEALILALGSDVMSANFDSDYRAAARSAYRKIDAVLSPSLRGQVDQLKQGLRFSVTNSLEAPELTILRTLREAIAAHRQVRIRYARPDGESTTTIQTERVVEPYQLTRLANDWYLAGYCHLRQATRVFRLARIDQVVVLDRTFDPAKHPGGEADACAGEPLFVQVLVHPNVARWVREPPQGMLLEEEETAEGVQMTLMAQSDQALVRWLLGWGGDVRVVEPVWLQALLISHAEQMLRNYGSRLNDG
jgi:predicted DNA-binding transcriptional regulator YafY